MASKCRVAVLEMKANGVRVSHCERNILHAMSEYATPEGFCWYAAATIAEFADLDRRNAQRTLRNLERRGIIRKWGWRTDKRRQGAHLYKIELPGLAAVTEATVKYLRSHRGGAPAVGWDELRRDLAVMIGGPKEGRHGDAPGEERHGDAPQRESRCVMGGPGGASSAAFEVRQDDAPTHNVLKALPYKLEGEGARSCPRTPHQQLPVAGHPPSPSISPDTPEEEKPQAVDEALYEQAVTIVRENQRASVSLLQRRLQIGYSRAARLVDVMSERGVVGPDRGSALRDVLPTAGDIDEEAVAVEKWWTAICQAAEGGAPRRRKVAEACRLAAVEMARRWGAEVDEVLLHVLLHRPQAAESAEKLCRYLVNGWGLDGFRLKPKRAPVAPRPEPAISEEDEKLSQLNLARMAEWREVLRTGGWEGFRAWVKAQAGKKGEDAA